MDLSFLKNIYLHFYDWHFIKIFCYIWLFDCFSMISNNVRCAFNEALSTELFNNKKEPSSTELDTFTMNYLSWYLNLLTVATRRREGPKISLNYCPTFLAPLAFNKNCFEESIIFIKNIKKILLFLRSKILFFLNSLKLSKLIFLLKEWNL